MKKEEKEVKPRYGTVNFEKRKHPRFDVNLPIEYVRSDLVTSHGEALNASEGGIAPLPSGKNGNWTASVAKIIFFFGF